MTGWAARRFWAEARAVPDEHGWTVHLDTRQLRTPAKRPFVVPTARLAEAVAAEWAAQGKTVQPPTMPLTRMANTAIDRVAVHTAEVAVQLAAYADTDLTCYRAEGPAGLIARQAAAWNPLLDWCADRHGARLSPRSGILHIPQDPEALARLAGVVARLDPFALTGLHDLVALSGSLVIGLAAMGPAFPRDALWDASRIDERWQEEAWGIDEEAAVRTSARRADFLLAGAFVDLVRR